MDKAMNCKACISDLHCSHERVLECITALAEEREIERFQPLLSGMRKPNIALKVTNFLTHTYNWVLISKNLQSWCIEVKIATACIYFLLFNFLPFGTIRVILISTKS